MIEAITTVCCLYVDVRLSSPQVFAWIYANLVNVLDADVVSLDKNTKY